MILGHVEDLANAMHKFKVQCPCGTKTIIPMYVDKRICRNCGHWVYRNKKLEFKDRLTQELKVKK